MNCRNARANFSGYVEQELSELERRALTEHIQGCPRCGSDLGAMQKAISLLRWVPRAEGSHDFTERLMARIRAEESQAPAAPSWLGRALDDLRQRYQEISAVLATPAPAGALIAALLVGGGGGALVAGMMGATGLTGGPSTMAVAPIIDAASPVQTVSTPAPLGVGRSEETKETALAQSSGPGADARGATANTNMMGSDARTSDGTAGTAAGIRLAAGSPPAAAGLDASVTPGPRVAGSRRAVAPSGADSRGIEVAEWASGGGKRLEGLPEGPPPISRVEYVLDQVDVSRKPVAVTTGVRAQEGSITF